MWTQKMKHVGVMAVVSLAVLASSQVMAGPRLDQVLQSKTLRVGTPGDYRPFAIQTDGAYSGHDIDVIEAMAKEMGVKVAYVPTTWPNLMADLQADKFDVAVGGITRNVTRISQAQMLPGYAPFGKVALVRKAEAGKYKRKYKIGFIGGKFFFGCKETRRTALAAHRRNFGIHLQSSV